MLHNNDADMKLLKITCYLSAICWKNQYTPPGESRISRETACYNLVVTDVLGSVGCSSSTSEEEKKQNNILPGHGQQTVLYCVSLSLGQTESSGQAVDGLDQSVHQLGVVI